MTTRMILLRNTVSRVTSPFEETYAKRLLADPHYGRILEEVDSEKPEVLGQPSVDGKPIADENATAETAPAPEKKD